MLLPLINVLASEETCCAFNLHVVCTLPVCFALIKLLLAWMIWVLSDSSEHNFCR
jgi:hypothetical protein